MKITKRHVEYENHQDTLTYYDGELKNVDVNYMMSDTLEISFIIFIGEGEVLFTRMNDEMLTPHAFYHKERNKKKYPGIGDFINSDEFKSILKIYLGNSSRIVHCYMYGYTQPTRLEGVKRNGSVVG